MDHNSPSAVKTKACCFLIFVCHISGIMIVYKLREFQAKSLQLLSCLQYLCAQIYTQWVTFIMALAQDWLSLACYFRHLIVLAWKPPLKLSKLNCLCSCTMWEELVHCNGNFISSLLWLCSETIHFSRFNGAVLTEVVLQFLIALNL